jgi:hypothetical protein
MAGAVYNFICARQTMSIVPKTDQYPRRVQELYTEIKELNGHPITAAQSRHILVKMAETSFDQWDYLTELHEALNKHVLGEEKKKQDAWEWTKKHLLPDLVRFVIVGVIAWIALVNQSIAP